MISTVIKFLATTEADLAQYLQLILTARVHEVASPTPLTKAHGLSEELGCNVMFKREDTQPGYSYRLRGIYNRMANLDKEQRWKGVITSSACKLSPRVRKPVSKIS
jgi:threonine dehydratase